jgi:hypothetical protein
MSAGLKRLVVGVVAIGAAVVGVAIAGHVASDTNGGLKPYGLRETLPQMVDSFGGNARVVEIIVGSSGIYYQVIGADRQVHIRDYSIAQSEIDAGTYGYNRKTSNSVRAPTAGESRTAVVTLSQIDPSVVDSLYGKVGFPRQGSSATLTGRSWFLESGAQPEQRFVAAYDGRGVQRTRLAAAPDPKAAAALPATRATPPPTSTTYSFTTTISSGSTKAGKLSRATQRLTTCIARAQGDVNKIIVCQRKFVP